LVGILFGLLTALDAAHSAEQDAFYRGKTIRIVVGGPAGGGFDTYSRAIARHIGKHVPGQPTVIVENMPGAGMLIAANHAYNVAKPDGLTMVNFIGGLLLGQLVGQPGIQFDAKKFEWLGVPSKDKVVCAFAKASGITSVEKWMAAKTPVKLGGVGRGTAPDDAAKFLKAALGLPIQLVTGYKGTPQIRLAAESGEVAGGCWQWESIKVTWRKALDAGEVSVVLQVTAQPLPELPTVPLAIQFAKTQEARTLIEMGIQNPAAITRLYALPPGTPKERVQMLRKAFLAALKDPELLAEAKQAKLEIDPIGGEELEGIVAQFFQVDPAVAATLKGVYLQ
jgi:tripartite-type tricarboxylate transporter receptor subunit TctC